VRELIQQGETGEVLRVIADTSFGDDVEKNWGTQHRMVNMDLAGGVWQLLLDSECLPSKPVSDLFINRAPRL
jgi:hypothetical protein